MLEANKSKWFEKIFAVYNRNLLKRYFHSFRVSNVQVLLERKPQILYFNHSGWWDGLIAFEISRLVGADSFFLMEEKHLKKLSLFRRLGAFSIVRENPRQAIESLNYAVRLLRENPRRKICIFPQGEILPNDARPLRFFRGLAHIVEKVGDCSVVPCAIRYEFLGDYKPAVFASIGESECFYQSGEFNSKNLTANFEHRMTALLDDLKRNVISGELSGGEVIF